LYCLQTHGKRSYRDYLLDHFWAITSSAIIVNTDYLKGTINCFATVAYNG